MPLTSKTSIEAIVFRPPSFAFLTSGEKNSFSSPEQNAASDMILAEGLAAFPRHTEIHGDKEETRPVATVYYFRPILIRGQTSGSHLADLGFRK